MDRDKEIDDIFKPIPDSNTFVWVPWVIGTALTITGVVGVGFLAGSLNTSQNSSEVRTLAQINATPVKDLKIKGNKNSKIFHLRGCPNYNDISERNIVWFKARAEAEAAGFRLARNC